MSNLKKTKRFSHYATLECGNGFYVDIITHNETALGTVVEAFLFHEQYGIKDLMFGCKLDDCRTYGNFIEMVSNNIDEYIESYKEDHMDEQQNIRRSNMSEFTVTQRVWDLDHWTIMERPIHSDEVYFHGTYPTKEAAEQALKEMKGE